MYFAPLGHLGLVRHGVQIVAALILSNSACVLTTRMWTMPVFINNGEIGTDKLVAPAFRFQCRWRDVVPPRLFVSQAEGALFEPSKAQFQMVGDVFENDWEGLFDCPSEQRLKSGSDEGQGARRVGVADQAFVFAPLRVAFPVAGFAAPMGANDRRQALRARFGFSQAADEMTNEYFVLLKGLDLGLGFGTGQLGLIGIIGLRCGGGWVDRRLGRRGAGVLGRRFVGRFGARLDQSASFGEVTGIGIGDNGAELPKIQAAVVSFG